MPFEQAEAKCLTWMVKHEHNFGEYDYAKEYFVPILTTLRDRAEARANPKAAGSKKGQVRKPSAHYHGSPYLKKKAKVKFEALLAILETPAEQVCARQPSSRRSAPTLVRRVPRSHVAA